MQSPTSLTHIQSPYGTPRTIQHQGYGSYVTDAVSAPPPPSLHPWGWQPLHCSAALLGLYQDVPSAWKSSSPLLRLAGPILLISTVLSPPCPCPDCLLTRAVCSSVFLLVSSPHFPPPDRERPAKSRPPAHTPVCSTRKTTGCMCPVAGGEDG